MTSKTVKIMVMAVLTVCMVTGAFASGKADNGRQVLMSTSVSTTGETVFPLTIEVPASIKDWFASNGVTVESADPEYMSIATRNSIKSLYGDNKSTLDALALAAMKPYLSEGKVETVISTFGPVTWKVAYAQDSEDGFSY